MSDTRIPNAMRDAVQVRSGRACEYCLISEDDALFTHEIDHIIAEVHQGQTILDNLAYACFDCNRHKGPNISSIDTQTKQLTRLFNPRTDIWTEHFSLHEARIVGVSAIGRVTVRLLQMNEIGRSRFRAYLIEHGDYP